MKIAALCPTFNRPRLLGQMIYCFERQTYDDRELIVLDDAGQYGDQRGDRWRIVSVGTRYPTVGAKRNALCEMTDAPLIAVWDDDDVYLPDALASTVAALEKSPWVRPSQALEWETDGVVGRYMTHTAGHEDYAYGGSWSYRKDAFIRAGKYPLCGNGDDCIFAQTARKILGKSGDCISEAFPDPWYIYSRDGDWHASEMGHGMTAFKTLREMEIVPCRELDIAPMRTFPETIPIELKKRKW